MALVREALKQVVKGLFHVEVLIRHLVDPVDAPHLHALAALADRLLFRARRGHKVAHALTRLDPRVAFQFTVGLDHRVAMHVQNLSERPLARQRARSRQRAADDLRFDLVGDLQIDRHLGGFVDTDFHAVFSLSLSAARSPARKDRALILQGYRCRSLHFII